MNNWYKLNGSGRMLYIMCLMNMFIAFMLAKQGSWFSIFVIITSAFCAFMTYSSKSVYQDHEDINNKKYKQDDN